jgi:hypothetical protein
LGGAVPEEPEIDISGTSAASAAKFVCEIELTHHRFGLSEADRLISKLTGMTIAGEI